MPTWNSKTVLTDEQTRINLAIINKLWGVNGEAVRNELFGQPDQKAVHDVLRTKHNFDIPEEVTIIMVDIDGARTTAFSASIHVSASIIALRVATSLPVRLLMMVRMEFFIRSNTSSPFADWSGV